MLLQIVVCFKEYEAYLNKNWKSMDDNSKEWFD